jgi:hypothetical protein
VDRLFLDANVLLSAAYRADAGVRRLWALPEAVLVTSSYAVEEARRNLSDEDQRDRLNNLLESVEVGEATMLPPELRCGVELPEKDWPAPGTAQAAGAKHLITGDMRHFGQHFGHRLPGVLVLRPGEYLKRRG